MAKTVQIRRGNSAENNCFVGQPGEVTMDMETKTLRVHDGETVGGTVLARMEDIPTVSETPTPNLDNMDYVVESGARGANPWYRKYKSGWIEVGGITDGSSGSYTIELPFVMESKSYFVSVTMISNNSGHNAICSYDKSPTSVTITANIGSAYINWEIKGWMAQ